MEMHYLRIRRWEMQPTVVKEMQRAVVKEMEPAAVTEMEHEVVTEWRWSQRVSWNYLRVVQTWLRQLRLTKNIVLQTLTLLSFKNRYI
ncbi:hypothetical protein L6452_20328 [Arctium lappa]|uniref:Uncharacterized protein n=1 Tax=Arctium lappa TaxID=4217 RepID=A0ACB9BBU6_ARCLA|nr:hypothetical protein L6452_20328 [Arctium lappa]